jgi:hypothetical protein
MRACVQKAIGLRSLAAFSSIAIGLAISGGAANATALVADGLSYNLTSTSLSGSTEEFTLVISGINGAGDTEKGRYGFDALAFTLPSHFSSATAVTPPSFTTSSGGLNSNGCDGSGNFFCLSGFEGSSTSGPALAANSSLSFVFDVVLSSGNFTTWAPDLKIDWVGTKNNYDLVSEGITPSVVTPPPPPPPPVQVPEPSTLALLGGMLLAFFGLRRFRQVWSSARA